MPDHISSDPHWPSYKVKSSYLMALASFRLGLRPSSPTSFDPLWVGRQGCGKLLKRERRIILKSGLETWTEYRLKSIVKSWVFSSHCWDYLYVNPICLIHNRGSMGSTGSSGPPENSRARVSWVMWSQPAQTAGPTTASACQAAEMQARVWVTAVLLPMYWSKWLEQK